MYEVMSFPALPPAKNMITRAKGPLRLTLESLEPLQGFLLDGKQRNLISQMTRAMKKATPPGQPERKFVTRSHDQDNTKVWVIRSE